MLLFRVYELRHAVEAVLVSEIINQAVVSERLSELELEQKQGNFQAILLTAKKKITGILCSSHASPFDHVG